MPFDLARLVRDIEEMATYYAGEYAPQLVTSSEQAQKLIQGVEQEELESAARQHKLRVLAVPLEDPSRPCPAPPPNTAYRVLGSDGSAMDSDPHFPARYTVLHVALAGMAYAPPDYWTHHHVRFLFRREEVEILPKGGTEALPVSGPVADTLRAYEELRVLWEAAHHLETDEHGRPLLAMMDAILLWTHRGTGPDHTALRDEYLSRSVALLSEFQRAGVPLVSFTSMPHHREVINTLMAQYCPPEKRMACAECEDPPAQCTVLRGLHDRHLFGFLPEGARSAVFQPIYQGDTRWRLPETAREPDPQLVVFYLNTGPDIARVELPFWIVQTGLLEQVHGIVMDQCQPLRAEVAGYPVALSMAHHEALLTTRDRRAIQTSIEEALARRQVFLAPSAKARMKER